jgi:hypothetical protein
MVGPDLTLLFDHHVALAPVLSVALDDDHPMTIRHC